ncbi:UVR8 [Symbiodinium natans]|uniref:UVR8 protein n=1 Tax=Symbiodinium natans TaxID=878477 RepID=A0A812MV10_9DINO|nr:UVR8 [Symbiodinium natans]
MMFLAAALLPCFTTAFKVTAVSAGGDHALMLLENGEVFAAGDNRHGQLCIGHKKAVDAAVRVDIGEKVKAVAAGCSHSLLITESGDVYAAGDNNHGQLGTGGSGSSEAFPVPTKMDLSALGAKVASVAAGCWFSLLLLESGEVYGVGLNSFGQLGLGATSPSVHTSLVKMQLTGKASSIAAGCTHSLVLLENGEVYGTGDNLDGQLGIGNTQDQATPSKVRAASRVVAIAAGTYHSLLLMENGEVAAVGSNLHGQLGIGSFDSQVLPGTWLLEAEAPVKAVAAGDFHSLVLLESGDVYATGDNSYRQLGIGVWDMTPTPRLMRLDESVTAVGAGWSYSLMIAESGEVFSAGYHLIHSREAGHAEHRPALPTRMECCG